MGNTMGFLRQQEENLATRLLAWQYQKMNLSLPEHQALKQQAAKLVDDAHRIARERGQNLVSIMKELVNSLKKQGG
ncbi:MAG: hypothetical protein BWK80_18590 [Desulfobacteraceae bacterium IS3]|nr:MAG: hypothetical protein BWK80_18590 [Desulfobacteraceae bacterium IS3]